MSSECYRKDFFCSTYSKEGDLVQFAIELKNIPGAIAEVAELFSAKHINILQGFHAVYPNQKKAIWGFFADLKASNEDVEDLIKEINKLDCILGVKFSRPIIDGLIVDELHFPITVSNERSILMKTKTFAHCFRGLREKFGSGANFILYEMGKAAGENKVRNINEQYNLDKLTALRLILAEKAAKGWCIPEIERFDEEKNEAIIVVQELFECVPFKGGNKGAKSQFFRGYLAGALSQLFKKPVSVIETECVANGYRNCKFVGQTRSEKLI